MIREISIDDAKDVLDIYNYYILNSTATFEEDPINEEEIIKRINKVKSINLPYIVAVEDKKIVGFAYTSMFHERCGYRYTGELTVYIKPDITSKGLGTKLYEELIKRLKKTQIKKVIGCISLPNEKSVALHEKFEMKQVGHLEKVGFKFGKWIDVG
jgi:L-amino acid N-acyltransferase YncA